jgi:hypothetical protein
MIRLWCKIMLKTNVEQIEGNDKSYYYLRVNYNLIES